MVSASMHKPQHNALAHTCSYRCMRQPTQMIPFKWYPNSLEVSKSLPRIFHAKADCSLFRTTVNLRGAIEHQSSIERLFPLHDVANGTPDVLLNWVIWATRFFAPVDHQSSLHTPSSVSWMLGHARSALDAFLASDLTEEGGEGS